MWSRCVAARVKQRAWFAWGVCLGAGAVLLCAPGPAPPGPAPRAAPGPAGPAPAPPRAGTAPPRAGGPAGAGAGPGVVRPRYYHTELGVRAPLLGAVLTAAAALGAGGRGAALNATARLPELKLFVLAGGARLEPPAAPGLVGFTDNREMLKPFHALKYLADNYLDEYNFFFLTDDSSYVDGVKLLELVKKLSVGQDVYMGIEDDNDSHYCSLESGIIISNSVLRLVQGALDWCVRNSYSAHHHENLGRCILHAAHRPCAHTLQVPTPASATRPHYSSGVQYPRARRPPPPAEGSPPPPPESPPPPPAFPPPPPAAPPLTPADHIHALHAYVSRESLREARIQMSVAAESAAQSAARGGGGSTGGGGGRGGWGTSWPPGLRRYPSTSANRFEYVRWRHFNATHGLQWEERGAAAPLSRATRAAIQAVVAEARQWLWRRADSAEARAAARAALLTAGAMRAEPHAALYYRLLLTAPQRKPVLLEAVRPLGAARLVSAPYVTESARLAVLLVRAPGPPGASEMDDVRAAVHALAPHCAGNKTTIVVVWAGVSAREVWGGGDGGGGGGAGAAGCVCVRASLRAALGGLRAHAALLLAPHHRATADALNRVRMNCLAGVQWFLPAAWARGAAGAVGARGGAGGGARGGAGGGARGGRFRGAAAPAAVAATAPDMLHALSQHPPPANLSEIEQVAYSLSRSPLACLHAPEPGILFTPPLEPPCGTSGGDRGTLDAQIVPNSNIAILNNNNIDLNENNAFKDINNNNLVDKISIPLKVNSDNVKSYKLDGACLKKLRDENFKTLELGSRQSLATLLLEHGDVDL